MSWRTIAVLNLLTLRLFFFFFNFNQEHVLKNHQTPRCPAARVSLSCCPRAARCPGLGWGPRAPSSGTAASQRRCRASAALLFRRPASLGFLRDLPYLFTCGKRGQASCTHVPRLVRALSFPGGNDPHTWPQRTEKNLTTEIPDLRGGRLGKHLPPAAGQCRSRDFAVRSTGPLSINQQARKAFVYFKTWLF